MEEAQGSTTSYPGDFVGIVIAPVERPGLAGVDAGRDTACPFFVVVPLSLQSPGDPLILMLEFSIGATASVLGSLQPEILHCHLLLN